MEERRQALRARDHDEDLSVAWYHSHVEALRAQQSDDGPAIDRDASFCTYACNTLPVSLEVPADPRQVVADGLSSGGPLEAVRDMLIADKVQGRKQFIRNLRGRHARSDELDLNFDLWLQALEVDAEAYDGLRASMTWQQKALLKLGGVCAVHDCPTIGRIR